MKGNPYHCLHLTESPRSGCTCAAGVLFDDVLVQSKPFMWRNLPCSLRWREANGSYCPRAQYPSQRERDEQAAEVAAMLERLDKTKRAIKERVGDARGVQGAIECPNCGATLGFTVHSNGHVWARCETDDCVNFME